MVVLVLALALPMAAVGASNGSIAGLWHFDGDANDSTTNNNDGTPQGDPEYVSGMFDQALSFDGSDDYVEVAHDDSLDMTSAYTMEAWVNITDVLTYRPILFRGATNANDIEVYVQTSTKDLIVAHNRGNGGTLEGVGFVDPPFETWFHLVVTFDGTDVLAYYNGIAQDVTQNDTAMVTPLDTDKSWWIGKVDHTAFGGTRLFKGLIDEVRIWNGALSAGDISDSYSLRLVEITKELTAYQIDGQNPVTGVDVPEVPDVPIQTPVEFTMEVTVDNGSDVPLDSVMVKDRLGAELEIVPFTLDPLEPFYETAGTADFYTTSGKNPKNRSAKVFITWDSFAPGDFDPEDSQTLTIIAKTDVNPGKPGGKNKGKIHQEYTSPGEYELNSGATLTFYVTIAGESIELVLAGTDPLLVTAWGIEDEEEEEDGD